MAPVECSVWLASIADPSPLLRDLLPSVVLREELTAPTIRAHDDMELRVAQEPAESFKQVWAAVGPPGTYAPSEQLHAATVKTLFGKMAHAG